MNNKWLTTLGLCLITLRAAAAADVVSTWDNSTGNWSDASRWSSALFPHNGNGGLTYDAVIGGGAVTIDQDIVIEALTHTGGAITGDFDLDMNAASTWSGGNLGGAGTTTFNASLTITNSHNLSDTRTINNAVSATFHGTSNHNINRAVGTTINNLAGSTLAIDGNNDFIGPGALNNAGTFNKSAGAAGDGVTVVAGAFANSGIVNVNSGELRLTGSGTQTGAFNVAAGGVLGFTGTFHIDAGTTIAGDGVTEISGGGSVNFNTALFNLDTLVTQSGSAILGDGTVNFNKAYTSFGTTHGGAGVSNFNAPVTLINGLGVSNTRTINIAAGATFHGTSNQTINRAVGTTFNNLAGSTLAIDGNNDLVGAGAFNNAGTFNKSAGAAGDGVTVVTGTFANSGIVNVNSGELRLTQTFSNYDAATDVLTGGEYNVTGTFRFQDADINTNRARITLNGPNSQIISQALVDALADFSLNDTGAFFGVIGGRDFATVAAAFTNRGQVQLGGGVWTSATMANEAGAEIFGFGTLAPRPTSAGTIRAAGGTLAVPLGIQGAGGTVRVDPGATLNLSGAALASSADTLIHNGAGLNLGAQNFSVGVDYQNANFGTGNAFNRRANVTGAGQILAAPGVTQTLGGGVTGGGTATATLAFGNVHVGDAPTLNYTINNAGAAGPSLRGAIQTTVGGANLTDARLTGAGATASNFGPIATGANSGNLAVTFNATSGGALTGQQVRIVNNFDNVGDQTLQITGAAYRYANPTAHTPAPVNFGIVHVGDVVSQALSITNNVPNDGFSERLDASIGSPTGHATTNGGSFSSLNAGATNNTSLVVGVDTSTAGTKTGTATISLTSNGTGTSDLGNTALANQIVNIQAQVNNFAAANVVKLGGHGTFGTSGANQFTLDLGSVVQGQDIAAELGVMNTAAAPADSLAGSFTPSAPNFTLTGFGPFSGLAAGNTHGGLSIKLVTTTAGTFAGQITLQPQSTNPQPFSMNLPLITIHLAAEVTLAGDYNGDGSVDAADYTVWRNSLGGTNLAADGNRDGVVDDLDYAVWKGNFGASSGGGSSLFSAEPLSPAVPEPASLVLLMLAVATASCLRQGRGPIPGQSVFVMDWYRGSGKSAKP